MPENTKGRDFVVGDIHGAFDWLEEAMSAVKFDPDRDRIISVGDLVDRGEQSARCLEFLKQPWFFAVRGNHEEIFMRIFEDGKLNAPLILGNLQNGVGWVLDETAETLNQIRRIFEDLPIAIEIPTSRGTVGFVHADIPLGLDWETFKKSVESGDKRTENIALWGRKRVTDGDARGVEGVGRVFFGHTPQPGGAVQLGNCFFVDTGGVFREFRGRNRTDCFLMLSNVMADAESLSEKFNHVAKRVHVIPDAPSKKKPFGKGPGPAL